MKYNQILHIFESYPQLEKKSISDDRTNFVFSKSNKQGKVLATQLSVTGNGYVLGKYMEPETARKYKVDSRGWISLKGFNEEKLRVLIIDALSSMGDNCLTSEYTPIQEKASDNFESLVRSCLYNWLGYGNLNSPVWFLGTEESGAEIWRNQTQTLTSSLRIRSEYDLAEDFVTVWELRCKVELSFFRGASVWNYIAAFLLAFHDEKVDTESIKDFVFQSKRLGRLDGDHFLGELFPLPKRSKNDIGDYRTIWSTVEGYHKEVQGNRLSLILEQLDNNKYVKLLIVYEATLVDLLKHSLQLVLLKSWQHEQESYSLYSLYISEGRAIQVLVTPFFGNGRISYRGIVDAVEKIKDRR